MMPRYHLNILDGITGELDEVGLELPSDTEAVAEVIRAVNELRMAEFAGDDWTDWTLEIVEDGRTVCRLTLDDLAPSPGVER